MSIVSQKIKCPRHFLLIPGKEPYITEIHPLYRKLPKWALKKFDIRAEKPKKDEYGRPIPNYKNYDQPYISSAEAIEKIYDPNNHVCRKQCKRRCFVGMGIPNLKSIRRLNG